MQPDNLHITQFTPSTLRSAIERAGFETVAIDTISPWHYIPPADRWRHRALLGYAYRAATLRTLKDDPRQRLRPPALGRPGGLLSRFFSACDRFSDDRAARSST